MHKTSKVSAVLIAVIVLGSIVIFQLSTVKEQPKRLVVPDDYPTIQAAVGNASAGDTVFVKNGIYYCDSVEIRKPLSLVGQDPDQTIIYGEPRPHGSQGTYNTVQIYASDVSVRNFTFTHCVYAVTVYEDTPCSNIQITGNKFLGNPFAISAGEVSDLLISDNYFSSNKERISMAVSISAVNGVVSNNIFWGNLGCLELSGQNIKVSDNQITNNTFGISLNSISNAIIFGNNITLNTGHDGDSKDYGYGIEFGANCNDSAIYDNSIVGNTNGINLRRFVIDYPDRTGQPPFMGSNNQIFNNHFINNSKNANIERTWSGENSAYLVNYTTGTAIVSWDNGANGNYWSDYNGNGSYVIDSNNVDYHPLTNQTTIPEFPAKVIMPLLFVLLSVAVVVRYRKT